MKEDNYISAIYKADIEITADTVSDKPNIPGADGCNGYELEDGGPGAGWTIGYGTCCTVCPALHGRYPPGGGGKSSTCGCPYSGTGVGSCIAAGTTM